VRIWLVLLVFAARVASAQPTAEPPVPATPAKVTVGVYVNHVTSVDIKNNKFEADFYIWFRWDGDDLKPLDTFEVVNGRINAKTAVVKRVKDGHNYTSARIQATITKFWNLKRFPLDSHTLRLEIEDTERDARQAIYVPDTENATVSDEVRVPGFVIAKSSGATQVHTYHTNYGDPSQPQGNESSWSRYIFSIEIERPNIGRFIKVFFGLFIAVLISWCAFHVRPKESSPRVSLGVGATFAAAAVTVAINNNLPDTNDVMLADKLVMLSLGMILASVVETIVALLLNARGKEAIQQRLDKICAIAFPVLYLVGLALIVS